MDAIGTTLSHEFLLAVQFHYSNIFINWGSPAYEYITEGQARFIQTVYMEYHSSGSNEEFREGRQYQYQANRYLTNDLNLSLTDVSYDYCLFWRFLYENYQSGSESDKLGILINLLEKSNSVGSDPIIDGRVSFNSALSSGGGSYTCFDDALMDFARNIYFNDPHFDYWEPDPSDNFYIYPAIKSTNTLSTDYQTPVIINSYIPSSFGIDYHIVNINSDVSAATVQLTKDSGYENIKLAFQVFGINSTSIISTYSDSLPSGISSKIFNIPIGSSDINAFIMNVIRLDTVEAINAYYTINVYPGTMVSGNVSGSWTIENSPYLVNGDITIDSENQLTIESGVGIFFKDYYNFDIYGTLLAQGEEDNKIFFTAIDTTNGWGGLNFIDQNLNKEDNSIIEYTKISYGKATGSYPYCCGGGVLCKNSSPTFNHCIISHCQASAGGAVFLLDNSNAIFHNCEFIMNSATEVVGGLYIFTQNYPSYPDISYSLFINNYAAQYGGAICCVSGGTYTYSPNLSDLTIYGNRADGFYDYEHNVFYPGATIVFEDLGNVNMYNDIIWENQSGAPAFMLKNDNGNSTVRVNNSDITYGIESYVMYFYNGYLGNIVFQEIINEDPKFIDPDNFDFSLQPLSPCIDAGICYRNSDYFTNLPLKLKERIRKYVSRANDPDGTVPDMGAISYYQPDYVNQPTNLTITHTAEGNIQLSWDEAEGAIYYAVQSSDTPDGNFVTIKDTLRALTYTDTLPPAKRFYKVIGKNNRTSE